MKWLTVNVSRLLMTTDLRESRIQRAMPSRLWLRGCKLTFVTIKKNRYRPKALLKFCKNKTLQSVVLKTYDQQKFLLAGLEVFKTFGIMKINNLKLFVDFFLEKNMKITVCQRWFQLIHTLPQKSNGIAIICVSCMAVYGGEWLHVRPTQVVKFLKRQDAFLKILSYPESWKCEYEGCLILASNFTHKERLSNWWLSDEIRN